MAPRKTKQEVKLRTYVSRFLLIYYDREARNIPTLQINIRI